MQAIPSTLPRPGLREALALWALLGLVAAAVFATYARLPPEVLYHTTVEGLAGGASRTLVYLNYPVALIALGILPFAVDRVAPRAPRAVAAVAMLAVALCALVAVPGVVDADDLDARPVNLGPAAGVALVLGLFLWALRAGGAGPAVRRTRGDRLRLVLLAILGLAAIPWVFAELGFYAPWPFLTDVVPPGEEIAAVHLGRHHGMDGVLLALAALALSRPLAGFRSRRLAAAAGAYLSLMLPYGLVNAAEDFWLEQVVKRGWTTVRVPEALQPAPSPVWALILVAAVAVYLLWFRPPRRADDASPDPSPT